MRAVIGFLIAFGITGSAIASPAVTGQKSVTAAGTAERLSTASNFCSMIVLSGDGNNTDVVVIGNSSVDATEATRKGLVLFPGQTEYMYGPSGTRLSLKDTWVDSETSGDGVSFNCIN